MQTIYTLTALSPLDGRYKENVQSIALLASEFSLIQTRMDIEARYVIALSQAKVIRRLTDKEKKFLLDIGSTLSETQAARVKEIEVTTRHDVKAVERALREILSQTSLSDITEMIHFGLTSEDINNLSHRLMLTRAVNQVYIPALQNIVADITAKAQKNKHVPMLARTHGQPAVPTTLGKELVNIAIRLHKQTVALRKIRLTGKLNGAVGNYNALVFAIPNIDWVAFSNTFIRELGLTPNLFTTQINPYEDIIEVFQAFQRINGILIDLNQDMWRYISDGWFVQEVKQGEIGSSTMPQKVNPIHFENSEGNLELANGIWDVLVQSLAVSRLQRDLSDSTLLRNIGTGLAYGLLAYQNTLQGLIRVRPNVHVLREALHKDWSIMTEAVQTILRVSGKQKDAHASIAQFSRGKTISEREWKIWIQNVDVDEQTKKKLKTLTPESYIGYAEKLTERAIKEISSKKKR